MGHEIVENIKGQQSSKKKKMETSLQRYGTNGY